MNAYCQAFGHAWTWRGQDTAFQPIVRCDRCGVTHVGPALITWTQYNNTHPEAGQPVCVTPITGNR